MDYQACRRRDKGNPGGGISNRGDGLVERAWNLIGIDRRRLCSPRSVDSAVKNTVLCVLRRRWATGAVGIWNLGAGI